MSETPEVATSLREVADLLEEESFAEAIRTATDVLGVFGERDRSATLRRVTRTRSGMVPEEQFEPGEAKAAAMYVNAETSASLLRTQFAQGMEAVLAAHERVDVEDVAETARELATLEEKTAKLEPVATRAAERQPAETFGPELVATASLDRDVVTPGETVAGQLVVGNEGGEAVSDLEHRVEASAGLSVSVGSLPATLEAGARETVTLELEVDDDRTGALRGEVTVGVQLSEAATTGASSTETTGTSSGGGFPGPGQEASPTPRSQTPTARRTETARSTGGGDGPQASTVVTLSSRTEEQAEAYEKHREQLRSPSTPTPGAGANSFGFEMDPTAPEVLGTLGLGTLGGAGVAARKYLRDDAGDGADPSDPSTDAPTAESGDDPAAESSEDPAAESGDDPTTDSDSTSVHDGESNREE